MAEPLFRSEVSKATFVWTGITIALLFGCIAVVSSIFGRRANDATGEVVAVVSVLISIIAILYPKRRVVVELDEEFLSLTRGSATQWILLSEISEFKFRDTDSEQAINLMLLSHRKVRVPDVPDLYLLVELLEVRGVRRV